MDTDETEEKKNHVPKGLDKGVEKKQRPRRVKSIRTPKSRKPTRRSLTS